MCEGDLTLGIGVGQVGMMAEQKSTWFGKIRQGLTRTRNSLTGRLAELFRYHSLDSSFWESLEEIFIEADVGMRATEQITDNLKALVRTHGWREPHQLEGSLRAELVKRLQSEPEPLFPKGLTVFLIVGINGTGKTTTIAKMAHAAQGQGKRVLLAAADTFRAAAIQQLDLWAERVAVEVVKQDRGSDAAAVVYDAVEASKARGADVVLVDTAGRLHTYDHLMEELKKIKRVAERASDGACLKTLLVLDATTGQNAFEQARRFNETLHLDGIILTKLDGTAKGGIVLSIKEELGVPVILLGLGEGVEDLEEFEAQAFVDSLLDWERLD